MLLTKNPLSTTLSLVLLLLLITTSSSSSSPQTKRQQVLQQQVATLLSTLTNKTIAMLTNPTSIDATMRPLFERVLQNSKKYNITVKCFFAPEHGLRGDRQDGQGDADYIDEQTGIQVYSLYGVRKAPTPDQLQGVDLLLYDIQDVGCRFYTFIWTLTFTIQSLNKAGKQLVVFDRPNPLGRKVEGCPLNFDVGLVGRLLPGQTFTIPQRYGLTIGEFLRYVSPYLPSVKTTVITMRQVYDLHDNEWVLSSPNMPTLQSVRVYPGMGLIEGTSLSEGRGTTKPFEMTGGPKISPTKVIDYFKRNNVTFDSFYLRQNFFIPTFSKHLNEVCGGVQVHISDYENYDSVQTGMHILRAYLQVSPQNISVSSGVDRLYGRIGFSQRIQNTNIKVKDILNDCKGDLDLYKVQYVKCFIYNGKGERMQGFGGVLEVGNENESLGNHQSKEYEKNLMAEE